MAYEIWHMKYEWGGLHRPFISRRTVDRRHRDVVEPQINSELSAMMNDVVHDEASKHGDLGQSHERDAALEQSPGLEQLFITCPGDCVARGCYILVESSQNLLSRISRLYSERLAARRLQIQRILIDRVNRPVRKICQVRGQATHSHGFLMWAPIKFVVGDSFQRLTSVGHLLIEFRQQ